MTRLIDADALLDFLDVGHLRPPTEICFSEVMVKNIIELMPTVDAVPVIRCKDCKHYNGLLYTLCPQSGMNVIDDEEDYCSWAERKEE